MPGVSSRQPVPGMYGIGKIHLKFKPKPPKKFPFGALLFGMACFSYALVYLNSIQWSRHNIVIPFFRWSIFSYGLLGSLVGSREVRLEGPGSAVRVYKNTDGVSCVEAGSVSDAMFGQGYLHASNHLYSLEMRRRTALGRLAEVEGYHSLPSDRLARVLRLKQLAMEDIAAESEENVQLLRNYASGVNAFLSSRRLPSLSLLIAGVLNIQEWTPEDTLMLMRLDALISSSALSKAALNLTLHYGVGAEAAAELMVAMESTSASDIGSHYTNSEFGTERSLKSSLETAWTTMYTKSGSPLLATSLSTLDGGLSSWHINDISAGPEFHVVGASRPGVPFVQHGHNHDLAWTLLSHDDGASGRLVEEDVRYENGEPMVAVHGEGGNMEGCVVDTDVESPAQTCSVDDTDSGTCAAAVSPGVSRRWCHLKPRSEVIAVRAKEVDTVETVLQTLNGPAVTTVLLSADVRFKDRLVTVGDPIVKQRMSIQFLKELNSAARTSDVSGAARKGSAAHARLLFATKENMGYIAVGDEDSAVFSGGVIASSRHAQGNHRIAEESMENHKNLISDLDFHRKLQCDSISLGAHWFSQYISQVLSAQKNKNELTEEENRTRGIAIELLNSFVSDSDYRESGPAPVFVELMIVAMKRILLAPIQRDPDIHRLVYAKKDYSTLKGSQSYRQMLVADSLWLFRLLELSRTNSSWWMTDAGGLETVVRKAVAEAMRTGEKYYGAPAAWDWGSIHTSLISRSVRFPFSPAGVDFGRSLSAGPYFVPGSTDSIFQNGYDGSLDEQPAYGHPLVSKACLRSTFRMVVDMSDPDTTAIVSGPGHATEVESYDYESTARAWANCQTVDMSWKSKPTPRMFSEIYIRSIE